MIFVLRYLWMLFNFLAAHCMQNMNIASTYVMAGFLGKHSPSNMGTLGGTLLTYFSILVSKRNLLLKGYFQEVHLNLNLVNCMYIFFVLHL